ncbi:hypothetical protein EY643_11680 [Halioglobus maricola]|uniref:Tetratricopeptide repeat protein n=1 Tax=Halioglobus maricola TaxID=2601894 RepID=A0A5P9NMW2_9GAMM|nr:hypothetical protein [Halioglobus maricola]QFU76268.1 hypothetical protein EY643_11680 [Halioglobus maricola]
MSAENNNEPDQQATLGFWKELRRRKVIRVASVYIVTGWLIIQVASSTFASFGIPDWAFRFVALMLLLGFPVALIITWAFELTPDGIKPSSKAVAAGDSTQALTAKRNWHAYGLGAAIPTLIFGTLGLFFYFQERTPVTAMSPSAKHQSTVMEVQIEESIAVMPLVNMSSHPENAFFAGGIHEDVLTNLSRIDDLQVISRTSMLKYAASDMTLREIGEELDVDYIVEGSVRRMGDHVRVTIQLINAHNDLHLWANNYEREVVDVFATQSELAREISDSIHLELQPESVGDLHDMPTVSVLAYDSYIKAASIEKTEGENEASMTRRRELLEQAVAEDPDFVEAWAVLKRLYDLQLDRLKRRGWYLSDEQDREKAIAELTADSQRALQKAVALDPQNEETLISQAVDYNWPKTAAEMETQRAIFDQIIAAYPDSAKAWYHLGHWHSHLVDLPDHDQETAWSAAIEAFDKALELDPFNARMVAAVLKWHRDKGFEESLPRLAARLNQILPETAADRNLARVAWNFKRRQIRSAFLITADESFLKEYEKGLAEAIVNENFVDPVFRFWDEVDLHIFTNDLDSLIEMSSDDVVPRESPWFPLVSNVVDAAAMTAHLSRQEQDSARLRARKVLANEEYVLSQTVDDGHEHIALLIKAHNLLGSNDQAERLTREVLSKIKADGEWQPWELSIVAGMDAERAVNLLFEQLEKHPEWNGFDGIAAYHLWSRKLLVHPRVKNYYLSEGKWTKFLAARLDEYAEPKP